MTKVNSPQDAEAIIQKLPCDMGIHRNPRKGTLNAPTKILKDFSTDRKILKNEVFTDEFSLEKTHGRIYRNTENVLRYDKSIISIGGDHSVSFPVIKALKEKFPDMELIWMDSHLDVKEKVGKNVSHDVVVRELLDQGFSIDEIYFVGITEIDHDETEYLNDKDASIFESDELDEFLRVFNTGEQPVYLSVDIDVLTKDQAPGTGYPDGELEVKDVLNTIEEVRPNFADIVEVAPPLDKEERTQENARKIFGKLLDETVRS
jgi:Arginase/agmatinase/formimionoglutamate hydrolase, arginase family